MFLRRQLQVGLLFGEVSVNYFSKPTVRSPEEAANPRQQHLSQLLAFSGLEAAVLRRQNPLVYQTHSVLARRCRQSQGSSHYRTHVHFAALLGRQGTVIT